MLHGHSPIGSSRAHFGFDFFLEGTWGRNKRLLACQRRTAMHLNREDEEGKGEILWWIPLVCFQPERPPLNGRRCGGTRYRSCTGQYRVIPNAFRFNLSSTANCQLPYVQTGATSFLYIHSFAFGHIYSTCCCVVP